MLVVAVILTVVFSLCVLAVVVIMVLMPVTIPAPRNVLPVISVSLAYEITQRESDPCNSSASSVSTI